MYIYESHLGCLYVSKEKLSENNVYCEQCGDCDWLVGYADTREEAWKLLKNNTDINGSGGWDYEYVQGFLNEYW